jgi:hypothetical protein
MYLSSQINFLCSSMDENLLGTSGPYLTVKTLSVLCGKQISVSYHKRLPLVPLIIQVSVHNFTLIYSYNLFLNIILTSVPSSTK